MNVGSKPGSPSASQKRDPITNADSRTRKQRPEHQDFHPEKRDANTCHPAPRRLGKGVGAPRDQRLLGSAVQRWRVSCADSEVSVGGNGDRGRGSVLPPEVSDRNQPCGRGESGPGTRCPAVCPRQTPSPRHVPLGAAAALRRPAPRTQRNPRNGGTGFGIGRVLAPPPWRGACGFHSYPPADVTVRAEGRGSGRWEVVLPRFRGSGRGAGWRGYRGAAVCSRSAALVRSAPPGPAFHGGVAALT